MNIYSHRIRVDGHDLLVRVADMCLRTIHGPAHLHDDHGCEGFIDTVHVLAGAGSREIRTSQRIADVVKAALRDGYEEFATSAIARHEERKTS